MIVDVMCEWYEWLWLGCVGGVCVSFVYMVVEGLDLFGCDLLDVDFFGVVLCNVNLFGCMLNSVNFFVVDMC